MRREQLFGFGSADLFAFNHAVDRFCDAVLASLRAVQIYVGQQHMITRCRADLCDARTHLTCPDNRN
jgi:hypothetical protein